MTVPCTRRCTVPQETRASRCGQGTVTDTMAASGSGGWGTSVWVPAAGVDHVSGTVGRVCRQLLRPGREDGARGAALSTATVPGAGTQDTWSRPPTSEYMIRGWARARRSQGQRLLVSPQPRPGPEGVSSGRQEEGAGMRCGQGAAPVPSRRELAARQRLRTPGGLLLCGGPGDSRCLATGLLGPLQLLISGLCPLITFHTVLESARARSLRWRRLRSRQGAIRFRRHGAGDVLFVPASDTRLGAGRAARGAARTKTGWEGPRRALRCEGEGEESSPRRFVDGRLVGRRCGGWRLPRARPEASRRKHAGVGRVQRHVAAFS